MLTITVFLVIFSNSAFNASIPAPAFPITTPGLATCKSNFNLLADLSISILATPAEYNLFFKKLRTLWSSNNKFPNSFLSVVNHLESQSFITPTLSPCGLTF